MGEEVARDTTRVLTVCADPATGAEIRDALQAAGAGVPRITPFTVSQVSGLDDALAALAASPTDVIVLCMSVDAPDPLRPLDHLRERSPETPIVVVMDRDDERVAMQAAEHGAQECIARNELVGNLLARSLHYAVERQDLLGQLERRSVVDELTGLYNRRGFFAVGEQEWRRARRKGDTFLLVYADLDGLKKVNDRDGHEEGDELIRSAAQVLTAVFRGTDIMARLGGDEFAVIAHQTGSSEPHVIRDRIRAESRTLFEGGKLKREVNFSIGIVPYEPATDPGVGLDQLLSRADTLMYEDKQRRKASR